VFAARAAARARVAEWLGEVGGSAAGKALKRRIDAFPKLAALLAGLAEGSPYLWELATSEPDRLLAMLDADPDRHFRQVLTTATRTAAATKSEDTAMRALRRMKAEAALLIALADIGGLWPVMQTTRALTELADAAVGAAVRFLLRDAASRGRLKPVDAVRPEQGSGLIVLAMGKMGAFELNYSSDIDLIVFYDPEAPALVDKDEASAIHVRITRGLVRMLQERTADGYVFRVDLRLRPDPASTHIAVSTEAALNYYGSVGQNWERAALIKARASAGRYRGRRNDPAAAQPVHLAEVSRLRRGGRHRGDEAANPRLPRPPGYRGRRPQYQARPRRYPRDRILRADPAAHRRRAASRAARP
jgi:glutamate-ammonia-ligase adenylyltransferase